MVWDILKSKYIFYLPANKNLYFFFPILYLLSYFFRIKIYYFIIGGWLPEFLKSKRYHRKFLKKIPAIFSETTKMKNNLCSWYGFNNIVLFPNFRISEFIPIYREQDGILKLVFMSRVKKIKGTDIVIKLAERLIENSESESISIDFYGPLNEYEGESFLDDINGNPILTYRGVLQPEEIYKVMVNYDCMIFPTKYKGEGFPGAIVDAYISGLPVIASDIRYNSEFVEHGHTGFLFDPYNIQELFDIIINLKNNEGLVSQLKKNSFNKSKQYSSRVAWDILSSNLS
jgi:glycosyltransferase involved in cell wall biosynthesis